jgi:hypothetical protein
MAINEALRLPSATRYYLKRYRDSLLTVSEGDNATATTMLQAVDYLLAEGDKQERL